MNTGVAGDMGTYWRDTRRMVLQAGISLAAAIIMASAAVDAVGADQPVKREIIPGSELMTSQERERYRERIRGAKTPEEEQKVRSEHLHQVRERARLRGLRLPEDSKEMRK
ncbi:MAG TPA: hypothetical protein VFP00_05140 [Burkholderiales bacterium]|nr:hypothetical protein [Burkholderiales bacterium]